jgi:hypothetical protein|tara:strand:+ start:720 stop:983 length:264 start_codon:yes stop_codon:yes gene_type:complete
MLKEVKYFIYIFIISFFVFFTVKYYVSDINKKNFFRSNNNIDEKINKYSEKLPVLEDNTKDILEYVEDTNQKKKKKFNFWKLIEDND